MKKLLILGGMKKSCQIIDQAKKMGIHTVIADYYDSDKAPAKLFADESFLTSATDIDGIVDLIRREHIDGVITGFADVLIPAYAAICEKAGLPSFFTPYQAELFLNKNLYKPLLQKHGVPTPSSSVIYENTIVNNENIPYPVIVKPVDNCGSRGCSICRNEEELLRHLPNAFAFSASKKVMIEEYIEGPEATAFFVIQDGNVYFTALGNRHVENHQGDGVIRLPLGYSYPSSLTKYYSEKIAPNVADMLKKEGITNGMLYMQCIIKDGVPMVYDLGLRLSGSLEYHMFEAACGFNPLEMMINFAVSGSMGPSIEAKADPYLNGKYGWNISALRTMGTVSKICGIDELENLPDVVHIDIAHENGHILAEADKGTLKQISCRFIGLSQSKEAMCAAARRITDTYDILDKNENSLLLPQIDFEKYINTF